MRGWGVVVVGAMWAGATVATTAPPASAATPPGAARAAATAAPVAPSERAASQSVSFGGGGIESLVPARVLDTRDGTGAPLGAVGPGSTTVLHVAGRGGVPLVGAGAVVLNVVATEATSSTYVTVYPTGVDRPLAANLNVLAGDTVPNLVVVKLGAGGAVSLFNLAGNVHLVADVQAWFPEASGIQPVTPTRFLDTRDGTGAPIFPIEADQVLRLEVAGQHGLPETGVGAVVMNVAVTQPTADGYLTVYPSGERRPTAANLNFVRGQTVPNLVIAKVGDDGAVDIYNYAGNSHVVADVAAWFPSGSGFTGVTPARILDTRDGTGAPAGKVGPGGTVPLQVTGRGGVPATGVGAVVVNVAVTEPTAASYITVSPTGVARPLAANLNMRSGQTVPNLVIAKVGADGMIDLFNYAGSTHLVADVAGWFPAAGDNQTTLDLLAGTTLEGAGDVLSFTGDSATGGTVTLAGSADVPPVGGHLAISPHPAVPDGLFGRVTATTANPDRSTTVTFVPARIEEGFADIDSHFEGPVDLSSGEDDASAPALRGGAVQDLGDAGCTTSGGLSLKPILTLGAGRLRFDLDLSERHLLFDLPLEAKLGLTASFTGTLTCTLTLPPLPPIPVPPALLEFSPTFTLSVSGALTTKAVVTASVRFGFEANGSHVENLSSFTPSATGDLDAELSASITFRPAITATVELFGVAGGFVDIGTNFVGTVEPFGLPCMRLSFQPTIDFGFSAGEWVLEWKITLASIRGPEIVIAEERKDCLAAAYDPLDEWNIVADMTDSGIWRSGEETETNTVSYSYTVNEDRLVLWNLDYVLWERHSCSPSAGTWGQDVTGSGPGAGTLVLGSGGHTPDAWGLDPSASYTPVFPTRNSSVPATITSRACGGGTYTSPWTSSPPVVAIFLPGTPQELRAMPVGTKLTLRYSQSSDSPLVHSSRLVEFTATKVL